MKYQALILLLLLLLPVASSAQGYCQIKQITVETVTNGLCIHLKTDGLMEAWYWDNFWSYSATRRINIVLNKVRSGADSLVEIAKYPVSHLEFTRPTDTDEDLLYCTLVLYKPSRLAAFQDVGDATGWLGTDLPQVIVTLTEQRNELLIMVVSDRPQEPPRAACGPGAAPQLEVSGTGEALTLHAVNSELRQVVEALSARTGVPVFLEDTVQLHVTAYLRGLSLARILRSLANGYGLALVWKDQAFYLSSGRARSAPSYEGATVRSVPMQFLYPEDAQALLPDAVLSMAKPNTRAQTMVLSGSQQIVDKLERDLHALDKPGYQVRIRAWAITCQGTDESLRNLMANVTGGNTQVEADSTGRLNIQINSGAASDILAKLHAQAQRLKVRVETVPEATVMNGYVANLFVGQQIYYWYQANGSTTQLQLSSVNVGSKLNIQPRTGGEWVTTYVRVEDNFLRETNALGPVVIKQTFDTTVRIHSGDTILIGGLQLANRDQQHGRVLPAWWPGGDMLSRHAKSETLNEVWVLLQADASQVPTGTHREKAEGIE